MSCLPSVSRGVQLQFIYSERRLPYNIYGSSAVVRVCRHNFWRRWQIESLCGKICIIKSASEVIIHELVNLAIDQLDGIGPLSLP